MACFARSRELVFRCGGNARKINGRDAEDLSGHGHGVGGELAAACAGAGTGIGFKSLKACLVNAARGVRADAFKNILDGNVDAVEFAGRDGSAVEHHAGNVEAAKSHDDAGHVLVAASNADQAVKEIAAGD